MADSTVTLDEALDLGERFSPADPLRLISLLSEQLRTELGQHSEPVTMLSLAGVGSELWAKIDAATYLEEERASWDS